MTGRLRKGIDATSKLGKALNLFGAGALGTSAVVVGGMTVNSESPMRAMGWLVSGSLLLAKCMEEELIICLPLTRAGRPIVSGLSLRDPVMAWKTHMGRFTTQMIDTIDGTNSVIDDHLAHGASIWRYFTRYYDDGDASPWGRLPER